MLGMWFDIAASEGAEIDLQTPALASCGALAGTVLKANTLQIFQIMPEEAVCQASELLQSMVSFL